MLRAAAGGAQTTATTLRSACARLLEELFPDELVALVPTDLPGDREVASFGDARRWNSRSGAASPRARSPLIANGAFAAVGEA